MSDSTIYHRTIVRKQIQSASLGTERQLLVYLPPGYDERLTYPVMYCQDGAEFFNFGRIATQMNKLVLEEDAEPAVIVGIEVDKERRSAEYSPDGSRIKAYETFFAEEMLPLIESSFPVRRNPCERIVAGDSLGGTVSLLLALHYRSLFGKVLSLSGAYLERWQSEWKADMTGLDVYMVAGLDETAVDTQWGQVDFLADNRAMRTLLEQKGASVLYKESQGKHLWGFWQKELPEALRYYFKRSAVV